MINALGSLAMPYLLYIKIGLVVVVLVALVGMGLHVRSVFNERDELLVDQGRLQTELTVEKLKYTSMLEQYEQISAMNKEIIEAVKHVKIKSNIYIDKVEASPLPAPAAGGSVFVPGGTFIGRVPQVSLPGFAGLPVVNYPFTDRTTAITP